FMAAAEQRWHGTYNVAATEPTCVQEIAATIGRLIGVEPVFARTGRPEPLPLIADLLRLSGLWDPRRFRSLEQGVALPVRATPPHDSKTLSCPSLVRVGFIERLGIMLLMPRPVQPAFRAKRRGRSPILNAVSAVVAVLMFGATFRAGNDRGMDQIVSSEPYGRILNAISAVMTE